MLISFCFSSLEGDVPVDDVTLERPFIVGPFEDHPFLTLGDYFNAVKSFILLDNGQHILHLLTHLWGKTVELEDIEKIIIRYEKYGSLYQIVSAEFFSQQRREKLAISTAMSDEAKETLNREFDIIQHLYYQKGGLSYIPRIYFRHTISLIKEELSETILLTLTEWFENYHEWHFSGDENNPEQVVIWDMEGGGYRAASDFEVYEIIRQASMILTFYYSEDTYCRIHPWHHGAGDFVVKTSNGTVDVRLITIRGYDPIVLFSREENIDIEKALILFLFDMTIKMRLDKIEGVGEPHWAEASILKAVIEGFFDALQSKESGNNPSDLKINALKNRLKSMDQDEMKKLFSFWLEQYRISDPSDYETIQKNIDNHIFELSRIFQIYSL